ncbi:MAG: hypothetical protein SWJ54_25335 [Cyanobacteriota bacterium]|nr:hypothetical protein [Cyanobacteriota bacterium]
MLLETFSSESEAKKFIKEKEKEGGYQDLYIVKLEGDPPRYQVRYERP